MNLKTKITEVLNENIDSKIIDYKNKITYSYNTINNRLNDLENDFICYDFKDKIVVIDFLENSLDLVILWLFIIRKEGIPLILEISKFQIDLLLKFPYFAIIKQKHTILSIDDTKFKAINTLYGEVLISENYFDVGNTKDYSLLLTSSGSTGAKKILKCSSEAILENVTANIDSLKIEKSDTTLVCLPLYYSYSLIAQFLSHLFVGANIVLGSNKFLTLYINEIVNATRPTNFFITPTLARVLNVYRIKIDVASLRFISIGGNYISKSCFLNFAQQFPCPYYYRTFGLTEAGPRVSTYRILFEEVDNYEANYIGIPIGKTKLEVGEHFRIINGLRISYLKIQSPSIFKGYLFNEDEVYGETYNTKDLVIKKEDKFYVLGRESDYYHDYGRLWKYQLEDILFKEIDGLLKIDINQKHDFLNVSLWRTKKNDLATIRLDLKDKIDPLVLEKMVIKDYNGTFAFSK